MGCLPSSLLNKPFISGRTNIPYANNRTRWAERVPQYSTNSAGTFRSGSALSSEVFHSDDESARSDTTLPIGLLKDYFRLGSTLEAADVGGVLEKELVHIHLSDQWLLISEQLEQIANDVVRLRFSYEHIPSVLEYLDRLIEVDTNHSKSVKIYESYNSKAVECTTFWEQTVSNSYKQQKNIYETLVPKHEVNDEMNVGLQMKRKQAKAGLLKIGDILKDLVKTYCTLTLIQNTVSRTPEPIKNGESVNEVLEEVVSILEENKEHIAQTIHCDISQLITHLRSLSDPETNLSLQEISLPARELRTVIVEALHKYTTKFNKLQAATTEMSTHLRNIRLQRDMDVHKMFNMSLIETAFEAPLLPRDNKSSIHLQICQEMKDLLVPETIPQIDKTEEKLEESLDEKDNLEERIVQQENENMATVDSTSEENVPDVIGTTLQHSNQED